MKKLLILGVVPLLCLLFGGCSHVGQMASAERHESAAIGKTDQAWRNLVGKVADYNQELRYNLSLPPTLETAKTADEILSLQYALTGKAPTPQEKLETFVNGLNKWDTASQNTVEEAKRVGWGLTSNLDQATQDRDKAVAVSHALATENATIADKFDALKSDFFWALGALAFIFILSVLYRLGVFGATIAAKVP